MTFNSKNCLALGAGALLLVALSSCDFTRKTRAGSPGDPANLLANNGRAYTGHVHNMMAFKSFRSEADVTLCLDRLDFMQERTDLPSGYSWLPTLYFDPPQEVRLAKDGTGFAAPEIPLALYGGARLYLSSRCASGQSVQVANAAGLFSTSDEIRLEYSGLAMVTPLTGQVQLETQTLVKSLESVSDGSQMHQRLFDPLENMFSGGVPYKGVAAHIPGVVEAENFDDGGQRAVYMFSNANNGVLLYRPERYIKIEKSSEGGYDLFGFNRDDYVTYSVDVAADNLYTVTARVAAANALGTFRLQVDGGDVTDWIPVPNTGGPQVWTDVSQGPIFLPQGRHYIRLISGNANVDRNLPTFSLDYLSFH